jgi:hypothetical protein
MSPDEKEKKIHQSGKIRDQNAPQILMGASNSNKIG